MLVNSKTIKTKNINEVLKEKKYETWEKLVFKAEMDTFRYSNIHIKVNI